MIPLDFLPVRTGSGIGKKHLPSGPSPQGPADPLELRRVSGRNTHDEVTWSHPASRSSRGASRHRQKAKQARWTKRRMASIVVHW